MGSLSLRVRYRPIRIGWCLESQVLDQLEAAIRLSTAFAGGRFNPLIPVDSSELAESLVERFRVDLLFPVADTPRINAFVDAHSYLLWPEFERKLFYEEWRHIPPRATLVDVYHGARRLRARGVPRRRMCLLSCEAGDPLGRVVLAMAGAYPTPSKSVPNYEEMVEFFLGIDRIVLRRDEEIPPGLRKRVTPSLLTTVGLEAEEPGPDHGFYVGDCGNVEDLLNYWNLRAAGSSVVFYDPHESKRLTKLLESHKRWLGAIPARPWQEGGAITVYGRDGGLDPDLSAIGERLLRRRIDVVSWNGLSIKPALRHWKERAVLGTLDESEQTPSVTFSLPGAPFYDVPELSHQYVGVSVRGFDPWSLAHDATFFPPYVPDLNEYYGRQLYYHYAHVRAEPESIWRSVALLVRASQSDVTLRALPSSELAVKLFGRFGVTAEPSPAGLVTSRLIAQMGGLQDCRVFKIEGVRDLIHRVSAERSFTRTYANQTIGNFDHTAKRMRFEPFEDLFIGPRPERRKLTPQDCLDFLLRRGVFRVGLELKCVRCELSFWLSLDDVGTRVECVYCGSSFGTTDQLKDRNWAYRRSGLFGRDDHQQGGIPVAITLQQLDTALHPGRMLYTTSLALTPKSASIEACETDFVVIATGHSHNSPHLPQVVVGECKASGGRISIDDADHLAMVADALPHRRLNVFVLFAKTGTFSQEETEAAARAQDRWRSRVILLSKDELEPYRIYERHAQEQQLGSMSLEDLAESTSLLYPRLRPRRIQEAEERELQRRVAKRAFELFENRGRGEGRDWEDWFAAEAELGARG